ncbi:MAG: glycosyltransferase family 4 protein [Anaerolineales bacterium]|jgi:glycosyltransferase involved in cell wall biosynthesis
MHILLIHQVFVRPEDPGGTRHFELAQQLVRSGHRVTILASSHNYQTGEKVTRVRREMLEPRLEIRRCWVAGSFTRSFFSRTIGFLSFLISSLVTGLTVRDVDLVWGTSPPLLQVVSAWLVARLKRIPWVFEVRDLWPAFAIQVGVLKDPLLIFCSERLERFLYSHADQIVVNSPGFIRHVTERGGAAGRLAVVPNGADTRMFDPRSDGRQFRLEHGLTGKFVALYAGAHGLSNDLPVVLEAAGRLGDDSRIALVLLGSGKEKADLIQKAQQLELKNVFFLPPVPKMQVAEALAAMDCGIAILKSIPLYGTTYPNKVFDYMAAGRPVVLAIEGEIRKVIEAAAAGIAVRPGDPEALAGAIRKLADAPEEAREMGRRGRSFVEAHFDRPRLAALMEHILVEVAAGRTVDLASGM